MKWSPGGNTLRADYLSPDWVSFALLLFVKPLKGFTDSLKVTFPSPSEIPNNIHLQKYRYLGLLRRVFARVLFVRQPDFLLSYILAQANSRKPVLN